MAILGLPRAPEPPLALARPWARRPRESLSLQKRRFDRNFVNFTSLFIINYVYDAALTLTTTMLLYQLR